MIAALLTWLASSLPSRQPSAPAEYVSPLELHKLARKNKRRGRR